MRAKLLQLSNELRGSYWFIPISMSFCTMSIAILALYCDRNYSQRIYEILPDLLITEPEGARTILSTLAGSLITVTGVCFSMAILSVSYASSHFGPRLITNLLRDRGNQVTLGVLISTFIFCLLVLRSIREEYEFTKDSTLSFFVPQFSVLVAMFFGLISILNLIYFFHHIPETINISKIISHTGNKLVANIEKLILQRSHEQGNADSFNLCTDLKWKYHVKSNSTGFIQTIDFKTLLEKAESVSGYTSLKYLPGEFIVEGSIIADLHSEIEIDEKKISDYLSAYVIGDGRNIDQDILFGLDILLEISIRALSPGVNDPFTAISALHWVRAALEKFSLLTSSHAVKVDDKGAVRVAYDGYHFEKALTRVNQVATHHIVNDQYVLLSFLRDMIDMYDSIPENGKPFLKRYVNELISNLNTEQLAISDKEKIQNF